MAYKKKTVNKKAPELSLSPEMMKQLQEDIKKQLLEEFKNDANLKESQATREREEASKIRQEFVAKMKASPEPWVDIIMWTETPQGVKYELDWNDAFIKHLEDQGIKGVDQDQTIQKWVAMLLYSTAGVMEEKLTPNDESKFE